MSCDHESCGNIDKVWLPYQANGRLMGLKPHPYCIHCGAVKNISSEKLKDVGYYMNVLAWIDKHITKITKIQRRLIAQELENNNEFSDSYAMTRHAQDILFSNIVKKYCNISEALITSTLNR